MQSKTITVRVRPHAKRTSMTEIMSDGSIKIDLAAPPDQGKANAELFRFLAEHFQVPVSHVELVTGQTSRRKVVKITSI